MKVPYDGRSVFFRVTSIDLTTNAVTVRLERFTLFWQQTDIMLRPGALFLLVHLLFGPTLCTLSHWHIVSAN